MSTGGKTGEEPVDRDETGALKEGEDFYMDGPAFVFTEAFHRKRGYCCGSGCRHCPYKGSSEPA